MKVIEEFYGQVVEGTSAKQYLLGLVEEDEGTFGVVALYGRIGAPTLQMNWKATGLADQAAAADAFAKARKEKSKYSVTPKPSGLDVATLVASHGRV